MTKKTCVVKDCGNAAVTSVSLHISTRYVVGSLGAEVRLCDSHKDIFREAWDSYSVGFQAPVPNINDDR